MTKKKTQTPHVVRVNASAWQRIEEQLKRVADFNDHTDRRLGRLEEGVNSLLAPKDTCCASTLRCRPMRLLGIASRIINDKPPERA